MHQSDPVEMMTLCILHFQNAYTMITSHYWQCSQIGIIIIIRWNYELRSYSRVNS